MTLTDSKNNKQNLFLNITFDTVVFSWILPHFLHTSPNIVTFHMQEQQGKEQREECQA